jgi:hypothetical protein
LALIQELNETSGKTDRRELQKSDSIWKFQNAEITNLEQLIENPQEESNYISLIFCILRMMKRKSI